MKCASAVELRPSRAIAEAKNSVRISNLRGGANLVERARADSNGFLLNANLSGDGPMQHAASGAQCSARSFFSRAAAASMVSSRFAKQNLAWDGADFGSA
jgi:hypothetical protein